MKSTLAGMLLLFVAATPLVAAQKSAPMELVIGTYREGNNVTEPRPAQSKYFKTTLGAFQLIQGFAAYKWFIEVIQHPEKRIYTRCIIENPQDPKRPFVYDGFIDPTTPSTGITHGPALGLKIYSDYTLEFIAYEDEARTKEIDKLTQKLRSYVDTTGPSLKLFKGMKAATKDSLQEHTTPPETEKK
ncbi:MAG: hypothetical protein ABIQ86_07450 [Steroidobacteraceae bacterium]